MRSANADDDFDRFKDVNDTHGHRAGDAVSAPSARDGIVTLTVLTPSIGLAARRHDSGHDLDALFRGTDAALLHAKSTGRDRIAVAEVPATVARRAVRLVTDSWGYSVLASRLRELLRLLSEVGFVPRCLLGGRCRDV